MVHYLFGGLMMFVVRTLVHLLLVLNLGMVSVNAGDNQLEFFENRIRPLLVQHCYECHNSTTAQEGDLSLDTAISWRRGGVTGPAIEPGDPAASLLIHAVRWDDPDLQMPPAEAGGKLSASQIADLEKWIADGAFDPRELPAGSSSEKKSWEQLYAERLQWWSWLPVQAPDVPERPDVHEALWQRSAIDRFLWQAMQRSQITPAPPADPLTLIRRVSLVLTGLPPDPSEIQSFLAHYAQDSEAAYIQLVDRLIDSPAFGERFARHWMDVVRFTETHGNEWNYDVPYAWRYRDYLIRAFNSDVPFDDFIREHIAGDLLSQPRRLETGENESVIGTAFYRFGEVNHDSCVLFPVIGYDIVDNQLDTLTKAFQATTVACARCHDHKLDAISTRDYHALLGILRSTRSVQHTLNDSAQAEAALTELAGIKSLLRQELINQWKTDLAQLDSSVLQKGIAGFAENAPTVEHPLFPFWHGVQEEQRLSASWDQWASDLRKLRDERLKFNQDHFVAVADFTTGVPSEWQVAGMAFSDNERLSGIRQQADLMVRGTGPEVVEKLVPPGLYTGLLSNKLNGSLRSPTLPRQGGKLSFEVIGRGFALARLVFNNCQLNYTNQHSLHHDQWSWVTVDFQDKPTGLFPYAELLTFWDNPKFPDPLGTLGKDTENQRLPWSEHAKNPRTWWGVRRIVAHDTAEVPRDTVDYLERIWQDKPPGSLAELVDIYRTIGTQALTAFEQGTASADDIRWLDWMLQQGWLQNQAGHSVRLQQSIDRYRAVESNSVPLPQMVAGVADEQQFIDQPVLLRGDYQRPGDVVPRGYLQAFQHLAADERSDKTQAAENATIRFTRQSESSGRAQLADSIAHKDNPLTARVMVNRVWQWIFGHGIVRTPDDFGHLGEQPSHPELLDYLADQFVNDAWSIKRLIRQLVLSEAFRSSAQRPEASHQVDPENRLLSYYPARRVEAEVIRDSLLSVAGKLDRQMYGPSIHPYRVAADTEKRLYEGPLDGAGRRSLYLKVQLMESPHFLGVFNTPGGKVAQGRRDRTNVPAQSLALLNDPLVIAMSQSWSERLLTEQNTTTADDRLQAMAWRAIGRPWSDSELKRWREFLSQFGPADGSTTVATDTSDSVEIWREVAHALFNMKEFIYIP